MKLSPHQLLVVLMGCAVFGVLNSARGQVPAFPKGVLQTGERLGQLRSLLGEEEIVRETPTKCGMGLVLSAVKAAQRRGGSLQKSVHSLMLRPSLQTSKLTPSGKLRIHYDTTAALIGDNTPALLDASGNRIPNTYNTFVDSVAQAADYCWRLEIDSLGYGTPPSDGTDGGGPEYDIYIEALGPGYFGSTWFDDSEIIS
ncbi:MAG: hypothetical protein HY966_02085, partial [Ignavibacteriales bacterium]|nr:hypothetical protein [Ignavibacteriales bacterium]